MTRVKISAAILGLLIVISYFSSTWVNHRCDAMLSDIADISRLAEEEMKEETVRRAKELSLEWEDFRTKASVLLKYDKLTETDRICSRIVNLAENDSEELQAELSELGDMLGLLRSGETPVLTSVF